jgi:two-component system, NtrC family, sensor kinase
VAAASMAMLESLGYSVTWFSVAMRALQHLESGNRVDLILTDIVMPGGVSGIDLARTVRQCYPNVPVLLTTGYSAAARDAAHEGFVLLTKPFRMTALEQVIRSALDQRWQRAQG